MFKRENYFKAINSYLSLSSTRKCTIFCSFFSNNAILIHKNLATIRFVPELDFSRVATLKFKKVNKHIGIWIWEKKEKEIKPCKSRRRISGGIDSSLIMNLFIFDDFFQHFGCALVFLGNFLHQSHCRTRLKQTQGSSFDSWSIIY